MDECKPLLTGGDRSFLAIQASGRTDTGVHARGQVLHFYTRAPITDLARFHKSLNGILPADISALAAGAYSRSLQSST